MEGNSVNQDIFADWSETEDVQELLSETGLSKEELEDTNLILQCMYKEA